MATEHLQDIIGVLRDGTHTAPPPKSDPALGGRAGPALDDTALTRPARESIAQLVERAHASGIPVRLAPPAEHDDAGPGEDGWPEPAPMVRLAAHRVVQEALTNAAKHAPDAPVTVTLARTGGGIAVSVVNDPALAGVPVPSPAAGGGRGLAGLAERVRLAGGALTAGPWPAAPAASC